MSTPIPWRSIQRQNFTSLQHLCQFLELDLIQIQQLLENSAFSLNLPKRLAEKIEKKNILDPIFRQFVPLKLENEEHQEFNNDPVGDLKVTKSKCLNKYADRTLILATSSCAMHCRYCFRKHYPYQTFSKDFTHEIKFIQQNKQLEEVILSGGDPLSLSDASLASLFTSFESAPHIKRVRFHTRFPIGIPERIDPSFLKLLENRPFQIFFVIHSNHPRELDKDVIAALKKIQKLGIPILNQSVLLKGVNDSIDVLEELCRTLINNGVQPYYLHQLDRVQGCSHFEVKEQVGISLIQELQNRLAGYAIPKYVREISGMPSKTILT